MIACSSGNFLRRALVLLLAVWLVAGPLASSAAATHRASHNGCKAASGKLGCHDGASCHGPARKVSCHGSKVSEQTSATKQPESRRRERCRCSDVAISATRCGCRHGSPAVAVSLEPALPKPIVKLEMPPEQGDADPQSRDFGLVVPADPPDPPPRLIRSFSLSY